jgi:hypothetical protein
VERHEAEPSAHLEHFFHAGMSEQVAQVHLTKPLSSLLFPKVKIVPDAAVSQLKD